MPTGKAALVTGGTGGIGLAIADRLAASGCAVMLNGLGDAGDIERRSAAMSADHGVTVAYNDADLTDTEAIEGLVARTARELGSLEIVINGAGLQHVAAIETFPTEIWNRIIAINLSATFHTTRLAIPHMRKAGWGRIVNISSAHGLVASPFKAPYVASKHGLIGFSKATALELGDAGITCNAICPGFVDSPMFHLQAGELADKFGVAKDAMVAEQVADKQAVAELIQTGEIAALVAFLCSDAARSITGTAIPIDGGWTAK